MKPTPEMIATAAIVFERFTQMGLERAVREALTAALALLPDQGWRTMETAPDATRDRPVDLWLNGRRFTNCHQTAPADELGGWADDRSRIIWLPSFGHPAPTHWRPLPPPPTEAEIGGAR